MIRGGVTGQVYQAAAIGIHQVYLIVAVPGGDEGDLFSVRRPGRCAVVALEFGQHLAMTADQRLDINDRFLALERHIGQARAVGRPGRRDDRFARSKRGLRALPVGIGDAQLEAGMVLGVEPLCYQTGYGYGMQNKDMMLVTDSGCELLSDYANTDRLLVVR